MTLTDARKIEPLIRALDTLSPNNVLATGLIGGQLPADVVNAMMRAGVAYVMAQLHTLGVDPG